MIRRLSRFLSASILLRNSYVGNSNCIWFFPVLQNIKKIADWRVWICRDLEIIFLCWMMVVILYMIFLKTQFWQSNIFANHGPMKLLYFLKLLAQKNHIMKILMFSTNLSKTVNPHIIYKMRIIFSYVSHIFIKGLSILLDFLLGRMFT